jgi:predicted lipid-binding transport protein (Tim44 family)
MKDIAGKLLAPLLIGVLAATFTFDAEAQRRFGGGKNLGRQSAPVQQRQATPAQQPPQAGNTQQSQTPAATAAPRPGAAAAPRSPWRGALMGLAAGLGIAALASYLGFGEALTMFLTVVLVGMVLLTLVGLFLRRTRGAAAQPAYQRAGGAMAGSSVPRTAAEGHSPNARQPVDYRSPAPSQSLPPQGSGTALPGSVMDQFARGAAADSAPWGIPAGFDTAGFLSAAKANYIKLQRAWDSGDLAELSEFTSNDMFIALTHELRARSAQSRTEVITLDAELLGIESTADEHIASVKFDGSLRVDGEIERVAEVWNLAKPVRGGGWVLAGIQQLA